LASGLDQLSSDVSEKRTDFVVFFQVPLLARPLSPSLPIKATAQLRSTLVALRTRDHLSVLFTDPQAPMLGTGEGAPWGALQTVALVSN
jgi:hypothetical protein